MIVFFTTSCSRQFVPSTHPSTSSASIVCPCWYYSSYIRLHTHYKLLRARYTLHRYDYSTEIWRSRVERIGHDTKGRIGDTRDDLQLVVFLRASSKRGCTCCRFSLQHQTSSFFRRSNSTKRCRSKFLKEKDHMTHQSLNQTHHRRWIPQTESRQLSAWVSTP